jgi:hypothetical protein
MSYFAKIHMVKGQKQVVMYKDRDDEGKPCVRMVTDVDGAVISMANGYTDDDDGWDRRDSAFDKQYGEDAALIFRNLAEDMISGLVPE